MLVLQTTYQRLQSAKLRELREELRGRPSEATSNAVDKLEAEWLVEDRSRFLHRILNDDAKAAPSINWRDF